MNHISTIPFIPYSKLIAATDSGKFWVVSNISSSSPSVPIISTSGSLGMDNLCVMRVHSAQSNLFITGGMERDLMLWDLEKIGSESSGLVENEQQTQQEVDVSATPLVQLTPVWKAKNVSKIEEDPFTNPLHMDYYSFYRFLTMRWICVNQFG